MLSEFMTATTKIFLLFKYCTEVVARVPESELPLFGLVDTENPTSSRNKNDFVEILLQHTKSGSIIKP